MACTAWNPRGRAARSRPERLAQITLITLLTAGIVAGLADEVARADLVVTSQSQGVTVVRDGQRWFITAPDGSIINYSEFNVFANQAVFFEQFLATNRVLNRVDQITPSIIAGRLSSNGIVYLVNPAGVVFDGSAVVDAAGLYAAAGDITDADFRAGVDRFALTGELVVGAEASIHATGIDLLGTRVANHGHLESEGGVIAMIAGSEVLLTKIGGRVVVHVDGTQLTDVDRPSPGRSTPLVNATPAVENTGTIVNGGGRVIFGAGDLVSLAFRNTGTVEAAGGEIDVAALDGLVHNTGVLDAGGGAGPGGTVRLLGPSILNDGAIRADAATSRAGLVSLTSANHTFLTSGSLLSASGGGGSADGGEVRVDSTMGTTIFGTGATIDVSGGAAGGDGGTVSLGGRSLIFGGLVRSGLATGRRNPGRTIIAGGGLDLTITAEGGDETFSFDRAADGMSFLRAGALAAIDGNVLVRAPRDVFLGAFPLDPDFTSLTFGHGNDVELAGRRVYLNAALDGIGDLSVRGGEFVRVRRPLDLDGSAVFDSPDIFLLGGTLSTGRGQDFLGDVWLGFDTVLTAAGVDFHARVNARSVPGPRTRLLINGAARFRGAVGDSGRSGRLQSLEVNGAAAIDGGLVRTVEHQRYLGATRIGADAVLESSGDGEIRFGGALDGGFDLTLETAGLTLLEGRVGGAETLGSLTTDAAGTTRIETDRITAGAIHFGDAVRIGRDALISGAEVVEFGGTVNGPARLRVASDRLVRFGGDVGGLTALAALRIDAGGMGLVDRNLIVFGGTLVRAVGDILLNPLGRDRPAQVASIAARGDLRVESLEGSIFTGVNEKITALGSLALTARRGTATLGDLNAVNDITVDAATILLRARPGGILLDAEGRLIRDRGMEVIAGGSIAFSTVPGIIGAGRLPIVATPRGAGISSTLRGLRRRRFPDLRPELFTFNPVLDLTVDPAAQDLGPAFAVTAPVRDRVSLAAYALRAQAALDLGIAMRALSPGELRGAAEGREIYNDLQPGGLRPAAHLTTVANRLRRPTLLRVLDRYARIFLRTESGEVTADPRRGEIRTELAEAWGAYTSSLGRTTTPDGFRAFLGRSEGHADARRTLQELGALFRDMWIMGLTPRELDVSLDAVLGPITPPAMDQPSLEQAIGADTIG